MSFKLCFSHCTEQKHQQNQRIVTTEKSFRKVRIFFNLMNSNAKSVSNRNIILKVAVAIAVE